MLAIAGGKGGCGKTTTAIGLAVCLVGTGRRPLVVDADLGMPDLHVRLGLDPDPGLGAVADGRPVAEVVRTSPARPGVAVCPVGGADAPVATALQRTCEWSGPVLVDCPAGASPDAATPLRVADGTVLVSTDTPESLEDTAKTAALARRLDAPPVGALVRGTPDRRTVSRLLGCEPVVAVPEPPDDPLGNGAVRAGYAKLADAVATMATRRDGRSGRRSRSRGG